MAKKDEINSVDMEKELEKLEDISNELRPTIDDFIERRIHHKSFAKAIFWLNLQAMKNNFVYTSELSKYMRLTQTRAYQILNDLVRVGIMTKNGDTANIVEFHFVKEEDKFLISKYFERAKKTLGLI